MRNLRLAVLVMASFAVSGCLVRAAADVVTAPVKIASKGVDLATTSQSEADEKRGRELRQREEELGRLERRYEEEMAECREGDDRACFAARETYSEMQILLRGNPALAEQQPPSD
ncbi:MAG: hypothetical protein ACO25F_09965 [Erythrobacter sp.]